MDPNPMMSSAYQQQQYNFPPSMDFPSEFLEPSISAAPMQNRTNPMFSPNTGYSSTNSSLSSSRNRLACDDSGVSSNVTLANEADPSSSMHFLSSALNTTVNDCMEQNPMNFVGNDLLDDLEPMPRDRSNTWPMRRPNNDLRSNNLNVQEVIEEEETNLYSKNGSQASIHLSQDPFNNNAMNVGYQGHHANSQELNYDSHNDYSGDNSPESGEDDFQGGVQKRSQTRRNAWGNMSYADLITQAILSSPDQRLTLSQIYEYMVSNVPYFSGKGDSNSSAGWKNSIRHNLSLHNRFMRIQNEGAGKSSWWIVNPDAKPGRNPRRRANTLESTSKVAIEKKRRGARKRVELGSIRGSTQGLNDSIAGSQLSMTSQDMFNDGGEDSLGTNFERFRARTQSNLSMPGNSSPHQFDDYDYPPWMNAANNTSLSSQLGPINSNVNDLLDRTDQMRLDTVDIKPLIDPLQPRQSPLQMPIPQLKPEDIKQEPIVMQQPPSYQDVIQNQGMRPLMQVQPPMLQQKMMPGNSATQPTFYSSNIFNSMSQTQMINQQPINGQPQMNNPASLNNQVPISQPSQHWMPQLQQPQMIYNQQFGNGAQLQSNGANMLLPNGRIMGQHLPSIGELGPAELPNDLACLNNLDSRFGDADLDAIMRTL